MINAVVGEAAGSAAAVAVTAAAMAVESVRRPQLLLLVQEAHDGACHACLDASRYWYEEERRQHLKAHRWRARARHRRGRGPSRPIN